jgi:cytochrome c556
VAPTTTVFRKSSALQTPSLFSQYRAMTPTRIAAAALTAGLSLATAGCGQAPVPSQAPEAIEAREVLTATDPMEIIEARRVLMREAGRQMEPIDQYTLGTPADPAALKSAAQTIEALLLALPHLFPPSTNRFDATTREPPTITLPAVWENFAAFQEMGVASEAAAARLMAAEGEEPLRDAARELRAACDACHVAFTKPYVPPTVTDEDRNFDFEQFLPK